jgi:hypothetical protein
MNDKGFSAVASESVIQKEDHYAYPDGYHVKLFMNSKVYELREADEKS